MDFMEDLIKKEKENQKNVYRTCNYVLESHPNHIKAQNCLTLLLYCRLHANYFAVNTLRSISLCSYTCSI